MWVVDANKKVFVYDTVGGLLGSWTLGSLNNNATVQGIATNGTDVWVVDSNADKVYNYAGAASRTSGSQNAASSFSLNTKGGNKSPTDIVTDGTSLWVVDNSTVDKVFKYTTAGAFSSSWTITTAGATSPTGITIDPTNVNHIWIVDNGTKRVYQYDYAANLPNGSNKAADAWFVLAAGNTNPQGIADPPLPRDLLTNETTVLSESVSTEAALRGNDAALEIMFCEPLKKSRIDTARPSVSRKVESHTRDLSYTVGAAPNYLTDDNRWARDNDSQSDVDDLFAEWDSNPLELLSLPDLGM